jgi:hypothetical protein
MINWASGRKSRTVKGWNLNVTELPKSIRVGVSQDAYRHYFDEADKIQVGLDADALRLYFRPNGEGGYHIMRQQKGHAVYFQIGKWAFEGSQKCFLGRHDIKRDENGMYIQGVR